MKIKPLALCLVLMFSICFVLDNTTEKASAQTNWIKDPSNPVLTNGTGSDWDSDAVEIPAVIKDGGTYKMWYSGSNGTYRIGYATSPDGITWTKYAGNPVLDLGGLNEFDSDDILGATVIKDGPIYKMWYSGFNGTAYRIGYATSPDGIIWTKYAGNPVLDLGSFGAWDDAFVFLPTVILNGMTYEMWYTGIGSGFTLAIGYATSSDGITWNKYVGNPVLNVGGVGEFDESFVYSGANSVFYDAPASTYRFWYSGLNASGTYTIGYATSPDGTTWNKYAGNPVLDIGAPGNWDSSMVLTPSVILDGIYKMWYGGYSFSIGQIGYAYEGVDLESPFIIVTAPPDGANGVLLDQDIIIIFNESIDITSFLYTILPDPGGWSWSWSMGNTVATGSHNPFTPSTIYTFTVTAAKDMAGNPLVPGPVPNPWSFTTGAVDNIPPNITATIPIDSTIGVALNQDVVITFNEQMNTTTFMYTIIPDPGGWTWTWSMGDTVVTGTHNNFAAFTPYTFTVTAAEDLAGNPLAAGPVPNPWSWTTGAPDTTSPNITVTSPVNLETGVALNQDVVITFSEAIDTGTFTYSCVPDPGGWTWTWSGGNTIATGTHAGFTGLTSYTFTVTAAEDMAGNPLAAGPVPNPWNWTSAGLGNVTGRVVDEEDDPIDNAEVKLYDSSENLISTEETDSNGNFTFTGVDEGNDYYLVVSKDGYESETKSNVDVTTGETEDVGDIILETDGTVGGKVVDENGDPLKDATVTLLDAEGNVVDTTTTDSDGEYKFEDLDYGTYKLKVNADGYGEETTGSFTLDKSNLNEPRPDVALTPTAGLMDWWWLIALIVIIVVIVIIIALILAKRKKKPVTMAPPPPDVSPAMPPPPPSESPTPPTTPPPPSPP